MNRILAFLAATAIGALFTAASYVTGTTMPFAHAGTGTPLRCTLTDDGNVNKCHTVKGVIAKATGRACAEEDSTNCYWNAQVQGNGRGHSFYAVQVGGRTCIIYWDRTYNRTHGHCIS